LQAITPNLSPLIL